MKRIVSLANRRPVRVWFARRWGGRGVQQLLALGQSFALLRGNTEKCLQATSREVTLQLSAGSPRVGWLGSKTSDESRDVCHLGLLIEQLPAVKSLSQRVIGGQSDVGVLGIQARQEYGQTARVGRGQLREDLIVASGSCQAIHDVLSGRRCRPPKRESITQVVRHGEQAENDGAQHGDAQEAPRTKPWPSESLTIDEMRCVPGHAEIHPDVASMSTNTTTCASVRAVACIASSGVSRSVIRLNCAARLAQSQQQLPDEVVVRVRSSILTDEDDRQNPNKLQSGTFVAPVLGS